MVEDSEDDALLTLLELRRGGFTLTWERVQTADGFRTALASRPWNAIIADYRLPGFDAPTALDILKQSQFDYPFIVVSGTIGEELAVAMMKAGAHDYLMKNNLTRLPEAVRREVREAQIRAERRAADRQLRQVAERERLTRMVTERIRRSLDLDDILTTTVTEVRQVLQTDRVILFRFKPGNRGYVAQESVGADWQSLLGQEIYDPCFDGIYIERYAQGRIWAIANIDDGSIQPCHADFLRQFQVQANLIVPIIQSIELWGLLIAHHCAHPRQWMEEEIQLLKQLADQVAIAIQQANLYQQSQLELAERQRAEAALQYLNQELEQRVQSRTQALQQQAEQERLLRLIVQNIHQSLDLDETLATVLRETRRTLHADRVAIYQFFPEQGGQFVAESVGEGWPTLVGKGIQPVWEGTFLQETQHGGDRTRDALAVNDIYTAGHKACCIDLLKQFQARAYAIAPIFLNDQLWGVLATYQNSGPRDWQAWELSLLRQIGIQMAIALRQSHLYQAAQDQVKELEKLHRLKDDFLSTVSHELRSPLANIKMAIQMLEVSLSHHQALDDRITRYLQILDEGCTQELTLINDLLDLQRLEAGVQTLMLERVDLSYWLPAVVEVFESRAQEQQQRLEVQIPPGLPCIMTDEIGMKRIIMELLHNACKYTPPHEEISVTAYATQTELHIQICNSGVELPPEELSHIFEKFYRVASVDRWKRGGTGLGLALVQHLVEHLGGAIAVESTNNLTCFIVHLPLEAENKVDQDQG
ncbi:MAG: GAF domain-containing protein [Synechococcales bacterium]|nr:GAF domain-containing protein [Synechococcales bacterium]